MPVTEPAKPESEAQVEELKIEIGTEVLLGKVRYIVREVRDGIAYCERPGCCEPARLEKLVPVPHSDEQFFVHWRKRNGFLPPFTDSELAAMEAEKANQQWAHLRGLSA